MTYVKNCRSDIFISYAHVDDEDLGGVRWVSQLKTVLEKQLNQELGARPAVEVWMDPALDGSRPLTEQLLEQIEGVGILLCVLSHGYIASEWCTREWQAFMERRMAQGYRIFFVQMRNIPRDQLPDPIQQLNLPMYKFWDIDPESKYDFAIAGPGDREGLLGLFRPLRRLTRDMASELRRLRQASESEFLAQPSQSQVVCTTLKPGYESPSKPHTAAIARDLEGRVVYLAEVTDDLEEERENVRCFLEQHTARVLPAQWYQDREPSRYAAAVQADLEHCDVFVQLLSTARGKKSTELPLGLPGLQWELAQKRGFLMYRWRRPDIVLTDIASEDWQQFISNVDVTACPISEFNALLLNKLKPAPEPPATRHLGVLGRTVFVNADPADKSVAEDICKDLAAYQVTSFRPLHDVDVRTFNEDWRNQLTICHGIIHVYGQAGRLWLRRQIAESNKVLVVREEPVKALGLCDAPPENKPDLQVSVPDLHFINCLRGIDQKALLQFVDKLGR